MSHQPQNLIRLEVRLYGKWVGITNLWDACEDFDLPLSQTEMGFQMLYDHREEFGEILDIPRWLPATTSHDRKLGIRHGSEALFFFKRKAWNRRFKSYFQGFFDALEGYFPGIKDDIRVIKYQLSENDWIEYEDSDQMAIVRDCPEDPMKKKIQSKEKCNVGS